MRALVLASLLLAACSNDGGGKPNACTDPPAPAGAAGDLTAPTAQRCNVPGSMGASHWYRMFATAPTDNLVFQVELWDGRGAFGTDKVHTGTFVLAGKDLDPATCGVCVRALQNYGAADAQEYFATGGTVDVTAVAPDMDAPFTVAVTGAAFDQIDTATKTVVTDGCTTTLDSISLTGTIVIKGGGGGGTGGGGGGGTSNCKATVGDP